MGTKFYEIYQSEEKIFFFLLFFSLVKIDLSGIALSLYPFRLMLAVGLL